MPHMKPSTPVKILLSDPNTFTTPLMAIVLEHFGTEALEWTPETIFLELADDFHVEVPKQNKDQITVGCNLLLSDDFYRRPSKFVQICNVLSGGELTPSFDKADAAECAWGITEAMLLAPPDDPENAFDPEILHYLGSVLNDEGIRQPPAVLSVALRDTNWSDVADYEDIPTDDPDMFANAFEKRTEKTKAIEEMLSKNFSELLSQLASIPGYEDRVSELVKGLHSAA